MKKFTFFFKTVIVIGLATLLIGFNRPDIPEETLLFINRILNNHFDSSLLTEPLKEFEIKVTKNGFCRFRKFFKNGKQEFFALNLNKYKTLDYYGSIKNGELYIRAKNDDVIVQTRNDKEGDVDSMARYMIIPLKDMAPESLNILAAKFADVNTEK